MTLSFSPPSLGAHSLDLAKNHTQPLGEYAEYMQEADRALGIEEAVEAYRENLYTPSHRSVLSLGIGVKPVWYRLEVENPQNAALPRRLRIETSWLDRIEVYFLRPGEESKSYVVGEHQPHGARPVAGRYFTIDHSFSPGRTDIYIRIASNDPMVLPVYLTDRESAYTSENQESYLYGFIYGVIFSLMGYNLMLFISLRVWRYFYFALYLGAFILMNMTYTGHAYDWLWPNLPGWQLWANHITIMLFPITGLIFATIFLNIRQYFPRLQRLVFVTTYVFVAMEALAILVNAQATALIITFIFIFVFAVFMLYMGVASLYVGNKSAKYFLIATMTHVCGASITALTTWGVLPYTEVAYHAVEIGMMLDAILLAMALADQFRITQEDKLRAEKLAKLDPLTGVNNRRAFYDLVKPVWEQAMENGQDMSVILIDIDRFKILNDTYGHNSGDYALAEIAKTLTGCIRSTDIMARWGGEEFVILLTNTPLHAAISIAERMRAEISNIMIPQADQAFTLTASLGVAHTRDTGEILESLVDQADKNLYEAKNLGRNQVYPAVAVS